MRSWEDADEAEAPEWADDKNRRKDFVGKVFMLTGVMLMLASCIIALPVVSDEIQEFFVHNALIIGIVALVVSVISLLTLTCCRKARHIFPLNLILLIILSLSYGVIAAMVACRYEISVILISFGATVGIVLLIGILAKWGPVDITGCGWFMCGLSIGLTVFLTIAIIVSIFYYIPLIQLIISCVVVVVYIIFLLYDMQMILGGRREELASDEIILGATILFIDIIVIFMYLLEIVYAISSSRS